jgi:hypothetical protein
MSYTSGNKAPTLMAQAPNRVGNKSKDPAKHGGGVTAVTRPQGGLSQPTGYQGAPSTGKDATTGRGQKVQVSRPAENCGYNDSYRSSSYLK